MYKQVKLSETEVCHSGILRVVDSTFIPFDEANTDYQEYLKWLSEGNEPEPADSPT